MTATEVAARLRRDTDSTVARFIEWAETRGRGEELRLLDPLVEAGLVEHCGDDYRLTFEGHIAVRNMLGGTPSTLTVAA